GWGGSCLPKDNSELIHFAETSNAEHCLLTAAVRTNRHQHRRIVETVQQVLGGTLAGRRIALFGLAFKTGTSDVRDSPAVPVARLLIDRGAMVVSYDPVTMANPCVECLSIADDPYRAADSADALLSMTDWPQFNDLDWQRIADVMNGTHVIDTRSGLCTAALHSVGLHHVTQWRAPGKDINP
ncbi:MAG: UDP binding domain-containing protein, partial [Sciscionella sp.]